MKNSNKSPTSVRVIVFAITVCWHVFGQTAWAVSFFTSSDFIPDFKVITPSSSASSEKAPNLNQPSRQKQESSASTILVAIVVILLILIIVALLYIKKSSAYSQFGNGKKIQGSENHRYDSKISLCSLIFDELNSVLYIAYGKKYSPISFTEIAAYEVLVNSKNLMKITGTDETVFDAETEQGLRFILSDLEKEKLAEDETRQIDINIVVASDQGMKPVLVNFYYREGEHRLSSHSFASSVDDVVLWCALLESAIHPVANAEIPQQSEVAPEEDYEADVLEYSDVSLNVSKVNDVGVKSTSNVNQAMPDNYDLADELTRLADLKAKGFLSEEEFLNAKAKIISR